MKIWYVLNTLSQETIGPVIDFVSDHPSTNKHRELKKSLIERNSVSDSSKVENGLSGTDMDDRKLSEMFSSWVDLTLLSTIIKSYG